MGIGIDAARQRTRPRRVAAEQLRRVLDVERAQLRRDHTDDREARFADVGRGDVHGIRGDVPSCEPARTGLRLRTRPPARCRRRCRRRGDPSRKSTLGCVRADRRRTGCGRRAPRSRPRRAPASRSRRARAPMCARGPPRRAPSSTARSTVRAAAAPTPSVPPPRTHRGARSARPRTRSGRSRSTAVRSAAGTIASNDLSGALCQ